mgnify:CR=1 FL=1
MENKELTVTEIAKKLSNKLNSFGSQQGKEFVAIFLKEHPTLQQRFMSEIVVRFIVEAVKCPYDDRNAKTHYICSKLLETLKQENAENGLPMI